MRERRNNRTKEGTLTKSNLKGGKWSSLWVILRENYNSSSINCIQTS